MVHKTVDDHLYSIDTYDLFYNDPTKVQALFEEFLPLFVQSPLAVTVAKQAFYSADFKMPKLRRADKVYQAEINLAVRLGADIRKWVDDKYLITTLPLEPKSSQSLREKAKLSLSPENLQEAEKQFDSPLDSNIFDEVNIRTRIKSAVITDISDAAMALQLENRIGSVQMPHLFGNYSLRNGLNLMTEYAMSGELRNPQVTPFALPERTLRGDICVAWRGPSIDKTNFIQLMAYASQNIIQLDDATTRSELVANPTYPANREYLRELLLPKEK